MKLIKLNGETLLCSAVKILTGTALLTITLFSSLDARTWTSGDGNKKFEAELESYNLDTGKLKLMTLKGKEMLLSQDMLSAKDIVWLKEKGAYRGSISCKGVTNTSTKPLKVFILAGQSNMQGSAHISTFPAMAADPATAPLLKQITDSDGNPVTAENTWITYTTQRKGENVIIEDRVSVGFGFDNKRIGPEYSFGLTMDKAQAINETVLIIKTAWGGKSLAVDFRPPSAGPYTPSEREKTAGKDVRQQLKKPKLPFVVGILGVVAILGV